MKYYLLLLIPLLSFSACDFAKEKKHAGASLLATLRKKTVKSAPAGQNPQMIRDFQTFLAKRYADTTVVYYDIYDMVIGDLNNDKQLDFAMQYSAPPEGDCLQCWEMYHVYFEAKDKRYVLMQEEKIGEGAGGNGSFVHIDSIARGNVYRTFYKIEEGDDVPSQKRDLLYYEGGKLLKPAVGTHL